MGREIKFRAWDKKEHCWAAGFSMAFHIQDDSTINFDKLQEHFDFQQYTGLKDKNGVEIYEGDIVAYSYEGKKNYPSNQKREVKWQNTVRSNGWNISSTTNTEVIGNIYENPDLLK